MKTSNKHSAIPQYPGHKREYVFFLSTESIAFLLQTDPTANRATDLISFLLQNTLDSQTMCKIVAIQESWMRARETTFREILNHLLFEGSSSCRKVKTVAFSGWWNRVEVGQHTISRRTPCSSPESICEGGRKWDLKSVHKTIKSITALEWPLIIQTIMALLVCAEAGVEGVTNWVGSLLNPFWQLEEYISKAKSHYFPWAHLTAG